MNNNINSILEKYWNAETSTQEEAQLKAYFCGDEVAPEHLQYVPLFVYFREKGSISTDIDLSTVGQSDEDINALVAKYWKAETSIEEEAIIARYIKSGDINPDHEVLVPLFQYYDAARAITTDQTFDMPHLEVDIEDLVLRYEKAETTIDEEKILKRYLASGKVAEAHEHLIPLFDYFDEQAQVGSSLDVEVLFRSQAQDIDQILDKYWDGESTLAEEQILSEYFASDQVEDHHRDIAPLFSYYAVQKAQASTSTDLSKTLQSAGAHKTDDQSAPQKSGKIIRLRRYLSAVAAVLVLGFAAVSVMNQSVDSEFQYKGKFVHLDEEAEAQEAYEITMQAFALLSHKIEKSNSTVSKSIKGVEKASIFNK